MQLLRERVTRVWLGLMAATCVSTWALSRHGLRPSVAMVGIFLVAALKVRFVMLDFMELRGAPRRARLIFQGWIVVVIALILGFWFAT
jgi:heme/copper-type cytochrome/quinol oxidase subunit 4